MSTPNPIQSILALVKRKADEERDALATKLFNRFPPDNEVYYDLDHTRQLGGILRTVLNEPNRHLVSSLRTSDDAWAMYLGLKQPFGSFEPSQYRPARGSGKGNYYSLPSIWAALGASDAIPLSGAAPGLEGGKIDRARKTKAIDSDLVAALLEATSSGRVALNGNVLPSPDGGYPGYALANFTMDRGRDAGGNYISIYDRWDLDRVPGADYLGRPFEIYDRLYYDPKTLKPLPARRAVRR